MRAKQNLVARCYDKRGNLISVGYNSYIKTHPMQAKLAKEVGQDHRIYLHAEVAAIVRAKGKRIHRISIERHSKTGALMDSCPCPVCMQAIKLAGISKIEYTITVSG